MAPRSQLSERQLRILEMIREFTAEYGYPPTIREIGEQVGISSTSVVSYNLDILQNKGYLSRSSEVSRGLKLTGDDEGDLADLPTPRAEERRVPLVGVIAAGEPFPVPDSDFPSLEVESLRLTSDMVSDVEGVYALQVRGTSMIDALINDGDIVIMRHTQTAENGDMVAALLKDEKSATLKRFYWERGQNMVRLQPANPLLQPI
jgi:repressor LexA